MLLCVQDKVYTVPVVNLTFSQFVHIYHNINFSAEQSIARKNNATNGVFQIFYSEL